MEEILSTLKGSTVFTTIDLTNAYSQVPLHDLVAFTTQDGLFHIVVPYGLSLVLE